MARAGMRGLYELEGGCGRRRVCPNSMGTVVLRPVRMRRALGCGVPLVADPSFCCSSGSLLLSLPLRLCLDPFPWTLYSFWASPIAADGCARRYADTALRS